VYIRNGARWRFCAFGIVHAGFRPFDCALFESCTKITFAVAFPNNFQCAECAAILRELRDGAPSDLWKLKESWLASGRDLGELRDQMLASFAQDDSADLLQSNYQRTREARRKMAEHEALTGHSVFTHGLRVAFPGPNF
jgi:hypothetical protein